MARCCARLCALVKVLLERGAKAREGFRERWQSLLTRAGHAAWEEEAEPMLQKSWQEASVSEITVRIRLISGEMALEYLAATAQTPIDALVEGVCEKNTLCKDCIDLWHGTTKLTTGCRLGDLVAPTCNEPIEVQLIKFSGPPVVAEAARCSSEITVLETVPEVGERCHFDRDYRFLSLGGFAKAPNMRYVLTSNDDKRTPVRQVMWRLKARVPVVVYLNFRGQDHAAVVEDAWLRPEGWELSKDKASTVSSGTPNGPYEGPVYSKSFDNGGTIDLMGSAYWEGTYLVFVQLQ